MGNHRFRLSDMMPNAWFYKLRDMSSSSSSSRGGGGGVMRGQKITPHYSLKHRSHQPPKPSSSSPSPTTPNPFLPNRASYYFSSRAAENTTTNLPSSPIHPKASDTHFPLVDPPRKSHRKPTPKPPVSRPSIKHLTSIPNPRNNNDDDDEEEERTQLELDAAAQLQLPPILTKPALKEEKPPRMDDKIMISSRSPARRSPPGIHRFRLRASSPRLANKRIQAHRARRSAQQRRGVLPESFAVVKKSSDPQRDFRESMVEMIVENNIRASKDLEELLACYLSLNSNEYHDLIIKVFEQIWFDLTDIRL